MTEIIDVSTETGHQSVVVTAPQQKPKTHFCTSCGKGFAAKHGLLQHNRRHPNGGCTLRTHVCECGKAFFQKNHLMLHQRQHLETKPSVASLQQQNQQQVSYAIHLHADMAIIPSLHLKDEHSNSFELGGC